MTKPWPRQFWSDPTSPKEIEKKELREKYASARKIFRLAYADMLSNLSQEALSNFSNGHLKFLEVIHSYMIRAELRDILSRRFGNRGRRWLDARFRDVEEPRAPGDE